jgi:hypothetical protein
VAWINPRWKPHDRFDLKLGSKGFFITIFHNHADREKIFKNGPYRFRSGGLHLHCWMEKFNRTRKILLMPLSGFDFIRYYRSIGMKKFWLALATL